MQTVTIEILNENAMSLLVDLEKLNVIRLLQTTKNDAEKRTLANIQRGAEEVKLHLEGKKSLRNLQSLIDEL